MTRILAVVLATLAISAFSSVAMAHPSGDRSTGETASGWGGATSDHTTGGLATEKSGGNNLNGGRN